MAVETAASVKSDFFDLNDWAEAATYDPAGTPVATRAILDKPAEKSFDLGGAGGAVQVTRKRVAHVPAVDFATPPVKGASILIGAATYSILFVEADEIAHVYRLTLKI